MEKQKNFEKLKEFIGLVDKSIRTSDFQQIYRLIPFINDLEERFLSGYHRRKKEGTFYTDKEISDFIVKETLLCLINKKLNNLAPDFEKIKNLNEIYKYDQHLKQKIIEMLSNITICDPACGSGEFLISAAEILYNTILKLDDNTSIINTKYKIVNNLFGYDINKFAINLCLLKLIRWYDTEHEIRIETLIPILKSNLRLENSIISLEFPKFDIIIGNPPYGNILNQEEKEILKKENIFYTDIYCAFLLKAVKWSNQIIGFLVPKSFLLRQNYTKFRNDFLSKANIFKIFDIGSKMFKNATNEVQIILYENRNNGKSRDLTIFNYPKTKIITYPNQYVDPLRICFNLECPLCSKSKKLYAYSFKKQCPFCGLDTTELNRIRIKPNQQIFQLIEKIEKIGDLNYLNPLNFPRMIRGEEELGLEHVKKKLRKNTSGSCLFINARNDFQYYALKKNKSFNIEELDSKILKGNNYEYYMKPKLLIKHNNVIPEAIYTEENVCFTSSIYSLLHKDIDELKYLCAVLNSILIQFYCIYAINNQKDTTINLNQYMIRHLPLVKPYIKIKREIAEKVEILNKMSNKDKETPNKDFILLTKGIDDIIFNLYSISDHEKNIVISTVKNQIKYFNKIYNN
ncbi:MAG: Eco57I restriction-modification methylase domain-containing protein [Candidatus Heimdallarchaeota archaeon]